MREKEKQSKQNAARYENSKFEEMNASAAAASNSKQQGTKDLRPKEEYDDPWEWYDLFALINQNHLDNSP